MSEQQRTNFRVVTIAPITQDKDAYAREYQRRYPTEELTTPSYVRYHEQTEFANQLRTKYQIAKQGYRNQASPLHVVDASACATKFGVQKQLISGLNPEHHQLLIEPAFDAGSELNRAGDYRADFLEQHPYGYDSLGKWNRHVGHMERAYRDGKEHDKLSRAHMELGIPGPSSSGSRSRIRYEYEDDYVLDEDDEDDEDEDDNVNRNVVTIAPGISGDRIRSQHRQRNVVTIAPDTSGDRVHSLHRQ